MNRTVNRSAAAVVITLIACAPPATETAKPSPIEGAWKIVDVTGSGSDSAATNHNPQASIVTIGPKYYSWMAVSSATPRALHKALTPTAAERLASYDSFVANSGTYERTDSTFSIHPILARVPNFMGETYHVRISGDTAWLQVASSDARFRVGNAEVSEPAGGITKYTLVRMK